MAKFAPGYPLPRSPDEFERLCLKLLRRHWQLPQLERFRDPKRAEKGINLIEISGRPRLAAVKCELSASRTDLTLAEIKDAVDRAASLKLPIGRFVIATTAGKPEGLQRSLFDLNRANRKDGISAIEVLTWDDIEELLDEYPQILTDFGTAAKRQALTRADAVVHLEARCEPAAAVPADALGEEISAAAALLESRQYQLARLALLRLREQKWGQLSNIHKFRVLSYLGAAWLKEGEPRKSAMLFIAAKSLQPDEENACTNEALAHELLGERERAFALADKLRMQFPSSGRAVALWLNNAPKSIDARELEENVAPELASDPEVAVVMARRALLDAHFDRAERYARLASTALPNNSIPWLVLGQAILLNELEAGGAGSTEAPAQNDGSRVREAESCFTQALTLAQAEHVASSEVQALMGRAQARIALRDTDGAGKDIELAHGLQREDANGLCEYGIVLRSRGSLTEAVEVLRRAASVGGRDDIDYHLAVTLRERDEPGDLQEATELLIRSISRPEAIPAGDFPFAVASAVEALAMLERYHDADALLASISDGRLPKVTMQTLRANLRLAQGKFDQASKFADEALSGLTPDTAADNRRKLAALLHDLGRYRDALPLWQTLAPAGTSSIDTRRLLDCASRLGREDIVNEISQPVASRASCRRRHLRRSTRQTRTQRSRSCVGRTRGTAPRASRRPRAPAAALDRRGSSGQGRSGRCRSQCDALGAGNSACARPRGRAIHARRRPRQRGACLRLRIAAPPGWQRRFASRIPGRARTGWPDAARTRLRRRRARRRAQFSRGEFQHRTLDPARGCQRRRRGAR